MASYQSLTTISSSNRPVPEDGFDLYQQWLVLDMMSSETRGLIPDMRNKINHSSSSVSQQPAHPSKPGRSYSLAEPAAASA